MKRKVCVRPSEQVVERLEAAAQRPGASKVAIVEAALARFLDAEAQTIDDATLPRRLEWMGRQLKQLERELRIVNETVALHARYHLTVTPPLPQAHQRAACVLGLERFEVFAAQVGRRVDLGVPLMRETMDRVSATRPDLFAREIEEDAALGEPAPDSHQDPVPQPLVNGELESSAGVPEDASNSSFPGEAGNPYR
jgi:hypothetical protein